MQDDDCKRAVRLRINAAKEQKTWKSIWLNDKLKRGLK